MINEGMRTDVIPDGYQSVRLNGNNLLRNLILQENGILYRIQGEKISKKPCSNSDNWIINNALIKLKGEEDYVKCSIFHEKGRKPGLYKILDDNLEISDVICVDEIEELFLKNNSKTPKIEVMGFD